VGRASQFGISTDTWFRVRVLSRMLIKQDIVHEKSYIEQLAKSMQNNLQQVGNDLENETKGKKVNAPFHLYIAGQRPSSAAALPDLSGGRDVG